jgi:hypothetical protein
VLQRSLQFRKVTLNPQYWQKLSKMTHYSK